MPIDPSIPLQSKGVQLATPESQLNMMASAAKLNEYTRSIDEQNALRDLIKSGVDIKSPEARQKMYEISPEMGIKFEKSQAELNKAALEGKKLGVELDQKTLEHTKQKMADLAFNPSNENVIAHFQDSIKKGELTPAQANERWQKISAMPINQRAQFFTEMGVKTEERYKMAEQMRHNKATEGIQSLAYDPTRQGQIAEARKIGEAKAELGVQPAKDVKGNLRALQTAGYDPIKGTDNISSLIEKSTSGALQTGAAAALGGANITTSGQKAIGQLETISKTMMLDLTNGKLGAGISNDDRKALEARFGEIGNSMIPAGRRLAAWTEAKDIMRRAAMLPEPQGEGEAVATTTKSGASTSNW